jgi:hypothetical protein
MRLPTAEHTSRPWRIHAIARDFRVEDVWALPTPGGPGDFPRLVELMATFDPTRNSNAVVRALFALRWRIGEVLGWDDDAPADRAGGPTLRDRLPPDLRDGPRSPTTEDLPFTPLYLTGDEWALEIVNRTVHGLMHVGWVPDGTGGHRGQMAVLVKPRGLLGTAYMAAITPFRYLLVYPAMMRAIGREWQART